MTVKKQNKTLQKVTYSKIQKHNTTLESLPVSTNSNTCNLVNVSKNKPFL